MRDRQGCLAGLLHLLFLDWIVDWLQERYGFGRGVSCTGLGCGVILLIVFLALACNTVTNTDWTRLL
jgi:hypothetical protein